MADGATRQKCQKREKRIRTPILKWKWTDSVIPDGQIRNGRCAAWIFHALFISILPLQWSQQFQEFSQVIFYISFNEGETNLKIIENFEKKVNGLERTTWSSLGEVFFLLSINKIHFAMKKIKLKTQDLSHHDLHPPWRWFNSTKVLPLFLLRKKSEPSGNRPECSRRAIESNRQSSAKTTFLDSSSPIVAMNYF